MFEHLPNSDRVVAGCGWVEDGIDPQPGQPGLRLRDTLVEVNGTSLMELSDQELGSHGSWGAIGIHLIPITLW